MHRKQMLAIALLAAAATSAYAGDTGKKDPQTGKSCVTYFSSAAAGPGAVHMNFRNICNSPFQISVMGEDKTRLGNIGPGSPASPAQAYVTCSVTDECDGAKWQYK
ncbi:MAG TPA: hypothetical protein VMH77_08860 [Steroidobacteraceae bacterium]|nr:hypothetical protein [Steroidobacteraceae bacterium]